MQKVQSYLYPNRVILIADLAGFTVENTIVYAKTIKIYQGVDNVIQFDIQNADQKRLELITAPSITQLKMNLMDSEGNALPNSPYTLLTTSTKGIATVTIPRAHTATLKHQFLKYSITGIDALSRTVPLYTDSRFSAVGNIDLVTSAVPIIRTSTVFDRFSGEINFMGNVINHTSAVPCRFYEAIASQTISFSVKLSNFIGTIYVEATEDSTISVNSFTDAVKLQSMTYNTATTTTLVFNDISVTNAKSSQSYNYMRISWLYPSVSPYGSYIPTSFGTVDLVTVTH